MGGGRKCFSVSRSVVGTVRRFDSKKYLKAYLELSRDVPSLFNRFKPATFIMVYPEILDVDYKKGRVLERVHIGETVDELNAASPVLRTGRYRASLINYLERKGIPRKKIFSLIGKANDELEYLRMRIVSSKEFKQKYEGIITDFGAKNMLVIDFDPSNEKFFVMPFDLVRNKKRVNIQED